MAFCPPIYTTYMSLLKLYGILGCLCLSSWLLAQDAFYTHYSGNEALFNPANVGLLGATTVTVKHKQQWQAPNHDGYQTSSALYEESMPCSLFDYGLSFTHDQEGAGRLQTQRIGGMLAAYVPLGRGNKSKRTADIRIGTGLHFGQQRIDLSRLTFIDQIHPKYGFNGPGGNGIPSSFVNPNDGRSDWYFQPSVGLSIRGLLATNWEEPIFASAGGAVHNLVPLGGDQGQNWSLLQIGTTTKPRYAFHGELTNVIKRYNNGGFLSITPRVVGQVQGPLSYVEIGARFGFSRQFAIGAGLHTARTNSEVRNTGTEDNPATRWGTLSIEMATFPFGGQRVDLGFSYAYNVSGLRNFVGNTLEFTARWSLATSLVCRLRGQKASYDGSDSLECPTARGGRGRDKIYENIWYKTGVLDKETSTQ